MKIETCEVYMPIGSLFYKNKRYWVVHRIEGGVSYGLPYEENMEMNFRFRVAEPQGMLALVDQLRNAYPFDVLEGESNVTQFSNLLDELEKISETLLLEENK